ncbi:hypothetical protein C2E23DRAFT_885220 [Lenzites betulinus]|nr:hypothetical protein C2E23DRAFT_885220 [Lenzites betulinus]
MSFIAADAVQLARDLWPSGLGRPAQDKTELKDLPTWKVVPASYEALCQWLYVDREDGEAVPRVLVHREDEAEATEMILRIQGIVADVNLNPLGNWKGDAAHAPKAVQALTIVGGPCKDAFGAQRRAICNIRELICQLLCLPSPGSKGGNDILLKRRVFTKVRALSESQTPSALTSQEDPVGRAAKIAHMWNVEHRITAGIQHENGTITRANPLVIRKGDFVDVAVSIQVITMRARRVRKSEILLCPLEVVRLMPALNVTVSPMIRT